jgi:hypothetical protein
MLFLVKCLLIQPLKSQKLFLPNLKYQWKNKYPPLAKNYTKGYHSVLTHVLYHSYDTSLITACAIFCSLKFHVVRTCSVFGDSICVLTNDQDSDWFTYCIDIWLMTLLKSLLPNPWVVLFFIYPTFYSLKILFSQPFSLRCHPSP